MTDQPTPATGAARYLPTTRRGWVLSVVAMLYVAGTIGFVIGARDGDRPAGDSVDVLFLQDMISHHEQAIELSNIELVAGVDAGSQGLRPGDPDLPGLRDRDHGGQAGGMGAFPAGPRRHGHGLDGPIPSPSTRCRGWPARTSCASSARPRAPAVDALFVPLMQDHHRGGVHMADYAAEAASDPHRAGVGGPHGPQPTGRDRRARRRPAAGRPRSHAGRVRPAPTSPPPPPPAETGHEGHGG